MKTLLVYNICGLGNSPPLDHYVKCIDSFLDQDFKDYQVLLSACKSDPVLFNNLYKKYKDKISYVYHHGIYTVNTTFNKAVQEYVKEKGPAESYMFVDSGCSFYNPEIDTLDTTILKNTYDTFKRYDNSIISLQTNSDEALQTINQKYKYESSKVQIVAEDLYVPLGNALNCHVTMFSHKMYEAYNSKLIPDVFRAHCTESTFRYLAAAVNTKWYVMKDQQVEHLKAIEGPSTGFQHVSPQHGNTWNNLLYDRDALGFIKDTEFINSGIGYEECNNILPHNKTAYDENDMPLDPEVMKKLINKYFFLTKEELDYNSMKVEAKI